jgi:very-short-patch-repair endonuclease
MRHGQKCNFARSLRRRMTDAELRLWFQLRNRAFIGYKFRRQHPIGPYIADFACVEARLVVELDGSRHLEAIDAIRTACLEIRGYHVLRFWNNDVLTQIEAVLAMIHQVLASRLHPNPSPASRRGA